MECPRCGFDNMPGSAVCFQCHADLKAPVAVSAEMFYPPRSAETKPGKALQRSRPQASPYWNQFKREASVAARSLCSVVPGLGQWLNGQRRKGMELFACACGLLALNLIFLRWPVSPLLVWLLVGLVGYSMLDAALVGISIATGIPVRDRLRVAVGAALLVLAFLLLARTGILAATNLVFLRVAIPGDMPGFSAGEVILARHARGVTPSRGELVVVQRARWADSIEVVLGMSGEEVSADGDALRVGGTALPDDLRLPLPAPDTRLVVPANSYFCLQYRFGYQAGRMSVQRWFVITPASAIRGIPVVVIDPPEKRRLLRWPL